MEINWTMNGTLLGACSCDWGCPGSFDAPPTREFCEGGYVWHVAERKFGGTPLARLAFSWMAHSPEALHKGNVTSLLVVDEKADTAQRKAILKLCEGKSGGP
jgi:hypothetical protein